MARDHDKYIYIELAIPRKVAWLARLEAEAEGKGLPLAKVALDHLAQSFLGAEIRPMPMLPSTPPAARTAPTVGRAQPQAENTPEPSLDDERATNNADAFLEGGGGFF